NYQRPELKFDTLDALIVQMNKDCMVAKETLNNLYS
ncbi:riboflavin kinase, partial [Amylibacter sp.]|nr:riboflavin kinase [Amylibacter sp.]